METIQLHVLLELLQWVGILLGSVKVGDLHQV